jgi:hypothetical protein
MKQSVHLSAFNNELHQATSCLHKNKSILLHHNLPQNNQAKADFQQMQQERFKKAAEFVLSLSALLIMSKPGSLKRTYLNSILTFVYKNAIAVTEKGFAINYRKVLISKGSLPRGELVHTKVSLDSIHFTWDGNNGKNTHRQRDRAILVAYCEALNRCAFSTWGARRCDGEAILEVPQFYGHEVHTWLSFISADGQSISNSMYAGPVTLSGFR